MGREAPARVCGYRGGGVTGNLRRDLFLGCLRRLGKPYARGKHHATKSNDVRRGKERSFWATEATRGLS